MRGYRSVGYALELMFTPTTVEATLYPADEPHAAPIHQTHAATADEAVRALIEHVTFDVDDEEDQ
jgi:sugar (pentulose or hexulose) kinase